MPFKIPSMTATRDFIRALFKGHFPNRNVGTNKSYHSRRLAVLAAATTQLHKHVDTVQRDLMPTTSPDGVVDEWGDINGTGARKAATPARKAAAGRVRGTLASVALLGEQLVHQNSGLRFALASQATIPAALFIDADIVAVDTGSATRLKKGEVIEFVNTIAGIEKQVVLQKDLDEDGFDREQYGAYRNRMLDTWGKPVSGGNQSDFVKWALEVPGITAAFGYPNRAGQGTGDVVALHSGTGAARLPNLAKRTEVLNHLKTRFPSTLAGDGGGLRVLELVLDNRTVEILVTPNGEAAWAFHWDDAVALVITAYNAGTREVTFSTALPPSMKAGHSLIIKGVASSQDGRQYKIEALSAADKVILETAPANNPLNTDLAYSGGPLVDPIRNAILAHMNGEKVYAGKNRTPLAESALASVVGLEPIAEGIGPANPGGKYGTWSGGLIRAVLGQITIYQAGVRNYSIPTPAADYEATDFTFPLDAQIGIIGASSVIVRKG